MALQAGYRGVMFHLLLLFGFFSTGVCLSRQYHFINENKTWAEAQRYCRENYVDLASINSTEEELAITNIINIWNRGRSWIGLYDDLNTWKWSLDDNALYKEGERSFKNWYIQKPRNLNGEDFCAYLVTDSEVWREAPCFITFPFICFDGRINASERYVLVDQYMNWTEAQRYCREHYTDLVSVRNETENQIISLLLSDYTYGYSTWIGLYKTRSWSDKSNSSFSNWKPGQPDNYGQNQYCTAVSFIDSGNWTDENCGEAFPFLCYSKMSSVSSHQYHFVNKNKSWTEAQSYCKEKYTDLASIDNMEDMNTLLNTVNGSYSGLAWIGLYDDPDSWRWSLDDGAFYKEGERDFRGWSHQPDNYNGKELCVYVNGQAEWFDKPCTNINHFVCYNGTTNTYVKIHYSMTWTEAQRFCRANHTDLASVRNETELQQILSLTKNTEIPLWIGLYRNRLWSDQSDLSFTYWRPTESKPQNRHCTAVNPSGEWTDDNCFARLPFICYSTLIPGAVMGLQLTIKANGNPSHSEIESLVLIELGQELSKLMGNITLNMRNIRKLKP